MSECFRERYLDLLSHLHDARSMVVRSEHSDTGQEGLHTRDQSI